MNKKRPKEYSQLSLALEFSSQPEKTVRLVTKTESQLSASVIAFPSQRTQAASFRERVIQDLMRNRVTVE